MNNNSKVLALKYRPQTFYDLIGQGVVVETITNAIKADKIPNAYLFTGIRGVGKTTIARIIAMGLNCEKEKSPTANPCGTCNNCLQILNDRYEDVLEIDAASHTGVDDVREIISSLKYRPAKGSFKVFIIDEVHMLSNSAFNALLKTIEEPPSYVKFIFCTTELNKIPITIVSRCQRYDLKRVLVEDISLFLKEIINLEGIQTSQKVINIIARCSGGSIRDSLTILDQCLLGSEDNLIDLEQVYQTVGITNNQTLLDLFYQIISGKMKIALEKTKELYQNGAEPKQIIEDLLRLNYNLILYTVKKEKKLDDYYDEDMLNLILEKCNLPFLNQIWQMLITGKEEMHKVNHPIEALEILVVRLAYTCKLPSLEEVVDIVKDRKNSINLDVNDREEIGDDIRKILDIFPEGKILKQ